MMKFLLLITTLACIHASAQDSSKTKPKEYLGILTLTIKYQDDKNWSKNDEAIVGEHFKRLIQMKNEGIVVLAGRTQLPTNSPDMMGLVIFYAKDDKEANEFMMNDPAVKNHIMSARVLPYGIALSKCN